MLKKQQLRSLFLPQEERCCSRNSYEDHGMTRTTVYVGGAGGASTVVPHLAKTMGHTSAKNAPVIQLSALLLLWSVTWLSAVLQPKSTMTLSVLWREAEARAIKMGAALNCWKLLLRLIPSVMLLRDCCCATELRSKKRCTLSTSECRRA